MYNRLIYITLLLSTYAPTTRSPSPESRAGISAFCEDQASPAHPYILGEKAPISVYCQDQSTGVFNSRVVNPEYLKFNSLSMRLCDDINEFITAYGAGALDIDPKYQWDSIIHQSMSKCISGHELYRKARGNYLKDPYTQITYQSRWHHIRYFCFLCATHKGTEVFIPVQGIRDLRDSIKKLPAISELMSDPSSCMIEDINRNRFNILADTGDIVVNPLIRPHASSLPIMNPWALSYESSLPIMNPWAFSHAFFCKLQMAWRDKLMSADEVERVPIGAFYPIQDYDKLLRRYQLEWSTFHNLKHVTRDQYKQKDILIGKLLHWGKRDENNYNSKESISYTHIIPHESLQRRPIQDCYLLGGNDGITHLQIRRVHELTEKVKLKMIARGIEDPVLVCIYTAGFIKTGDPKKLCNIIVPSDKIELREEAAYSF